MTTLQETVVCSEPNEVEEPILLRYLRDLLQEEEELLRRSRLAVQPPPTPSSQVRFNRD